MRKNWVLRCLKIAGIAAVAVAALSYLVMGLWNGLMPGVFGLHVISFWQALGLLILSKILFGGFRGRSGGGPWRRRMRDRWEHMTPEERAKFKEGMRNRCGQPQGVEAGVKV